MTISFHFYQSVLTDLCYLNSIRSVSHSYRSSFIYTYVWHYNVIHTFLHTYVLTNNMIRHQYSIPYVTNITYHNTILLINYAIVCILSLSYPCLWYCAYSFRYSVICSSLIPSILFWCLIYSAHCNGFVKKSPIISSVGQYFNHSSLFLILSVTKKYLILMWREFFPTEFMPLFANSIVLWLSRLTITSSTVYFSQQNLLMK